MTKIEAMNDHHNVISALLRIENHRKKNPSAEDERQYDRWLSELQTLDEHACSAVLPIFEAEFGPEPAGCVDRYYIEPLPDLTNVHGAVERKFIKGDQITRIEVYHWRVVDGQVNFRKAEV